MRYSVVLLFLFASPIFGFAQGPCTEPAVKEGKLPMADDAFSYMPPFGKPVSGKTAIQDTAEKKFAGRTNIKHSWESDRRIVALTSGDMAYEHGTMDMSYEEDGKRHSFSCRPAISCRCLRGLPVLVHEVSRRAWGLRLRD